MTLSRRAGYGRYGCNPVRSRRSVRWPAAGGAVKAGITALAAYTDLSDDDVPTYAVRDSEFAPLRNGGGLTVSATRDEADAVLELWCYAPGVLAVLADDDLPVVALRTSLYRQLLAQGELARGHDHTDSSGVVESWAYDPKLTAVESVVDPLSLYLSLKGAHDERVLKALDQVMGKITW